MSAVTPPEYGNYLFDKAHEQIPNPETKTAIFSAYLKGSMPEEIKNDYEKFCQSIEVMAIHAAELGNASSARSIANIILCFKSKIPCSELHRSLLLKERRERCFCQIAVTLSEKKDIDETLNEITFSHVKSPAYALIACKLNRINLELANEYGNHIKNHIHYKEPFNLSREIELSRQKMVEKNFFPLSTNVLNRKQTEPSLTEIIHQLINDQKFDEAHEQIHSYLLNKI